MYVYTCRTLVQFWDADTMWMKWSITGPEGYFWGSMCAPIGLPHKKANSLLNAALISIGL